MWTQKIREYTYLLITVNETKTPIRETDTWQK